MVKVTDSANIVAMGKIVGVKVYEYSGAIWATDLERAPYNDDYSVTGTGLNDPFRASVNNFLEAMKSSTAKFVVYTGKKAPAGNTIKVGSVFRSIQRQYLLYHSTKITVGVNEDGEEKVTEAAKDVMPLSTEVPGNELLIEWVHFDDPKGTKSKKYAMELFKKFGVSGNLVAKPGRSEHSKHTAIDLTIKWKKNFVIMVPTSSGGTEPFTVVTGKTPDQTNSTLIEAASRFGIIHIPKVSEDPVHFSIDGK